jgi:hypothetical protein
MRALTRRFRVVDSRDDSGWLGLIVSVEFQSSEGRVELPFMSPLKRWAALVSAVLASGVLVPVILSLLRSSSLQNVSIAVLYMCAALALVWWIALVCFLDKVVVSVNRYEVRIRHTPIPWPGSRRIDVADICQVMAERHPNGVHYRVNIRRQNDCWTTLYGKARSLEQATAIEQHIESVLRILDEQSDAESGERSEVFSGWGQDVYSFPVRVKLHRYDKVTRLEYRPPAFRSPAEFLAYPVLALLVASFIHSESWFWLGLAVAAIVLDLWKKIMRRRTCVEITDSKLTLHEPPSLLFQSRLLDVDRARVTGLDVRSRRADPDSSAVKRFRRQYRIEIHCRDGMKFVIVGNVPTRAEATAVARLLSSALDVPIRPMKRSNESPAGESADGDSQSV